MFYFCRFHYYTIVQRPFIVIVPLEMFSKALSLSLFLLEMFSKALCFPGFPPRFCFMIIEPMASHIVYFEDILALGQKAIEDQILAVDKECHKYERCDGLNARLLRLNQDTRIKEQVAKNESAKAPTTFLAKRLAVIKKEYLEGVLALIKELNA